MLKISVHFNICKAEKVCYVNWFIFVRYISPRFAKKKNPFYSLRHSNTVWKFQWSVFFFFFLVCSRMIDLFDGQEKCIELCNLPYYSIICLLTKVMFIHSQIRRDEIYNLEVQNRTSNRISLHSLSLHSFNLSSFTVIWGLQSPRKMYIEINYRIVSLIE